MQLLFVLAFVLGQISPACAFVSGKSSMIEICASDGSTKKIEVSAAFDPTVKKSDSNKKIKANECAFCFFQTHIGKASVYTTELDFIIPSSYKVASSGMIAPAFLNNIQTQPRAPPALS